jgi:hypothetical protein
VVTTRILPCRRGGLTHLRLADQRTRWRQNQHEQ